MTADEHESKESEVSLSLPRDDWKHLADSMACHVALIDFDLPEKAERLRRLVNILSRQRLSYKAAPTAGTATDAANAKPFQTCPQCLGSRTDSGQPCVRCDGTGFYPVQRARYVNAGAMKHVPYDFGDDE